MKDNGLNHLLSNNPFLDEERIGDYFCKKLINYLDKELQAYCESDDYYPPVGDDFDAEGCIETWCYKNGFSLLSFNGVGETDGYEPVF